jgi:hypothetical protein
LRGILTKTVLFLCEKHWNAVLKTLESGVFYTTLYRSVSLGIWKQPTLVTFTEYRNTYHFSRPMNLILPYSLCLGIGLIIIILGLWSLYQNEIPAADGSFLQIVMATKGGTKLEELVIKQGLVGSTEVSKELKDLKVRFGELVSDAHEGAGKRYGFGTVEETVPLRKRKIYLMNKAGI